MLKSRICSLWAALIIALLPLHASAQMSESEFTQYVPAEAFILISVNMETVMEKVDQTSEILKRFREREKFSSTDFTEANQYLIVMAGGVEPESEYDFPVMMFTRYGESLSPQAYNKAAEEQGFGLKMTYEAESYKDHEFYVGSYKQDDGVVLEGPKQAHFFPAENIVAFGTRSVITAAIDSLGDDSIGQERAGNLILDAELHVLIEDGANIVKSDYFEMIFGQLAGELGLPDGVDPLELLESLQRAELIVDSSQMTPVMATIEMKTDDAAEQVEELIKTGLQAAPALLMMGESTLDDAVENEQEEIEPVVEESKRMIALGKAVVEDLQVERTGSTIQIQLANVDGLEKFPQDIMTFVAHQQMNMEKMMEELQGMDVMPMIEAAPVEIAEDDDGEEQADDDDDDDDGI